MKHFVISLISFIFIASPIIAEETNGTIGSAKILNPKKSGRTVLGKLGSPLTIVVKGTKLSLKTGKWISYYDDNKYVIAATLAKRVKMKVGSRVVKFDRGAALRFAYQPDNHYVQYAELMNRSNLKIDGLSIKISKRGRRKSKGGVIKFDQDGKITQIITTTAKKYKIGSYQIKLPKATTINFKNEKVVGVRPDYKKKIYVKVSGKKYYAQSIIFNDNKKIKQLRTSKAMTVKVKDKNKKVKKGGTIYFDDAGKITRAR